MRILVNPDRLRALSAQLRQAASNLRSVGSRVDGVMGGLDWETRQKVGMEEQVGHTCNQARALAARAEEMSHYLAAKAQAFEKADRQGVIDLETVIDKYPIPVPTPILTSAPVRNPDFSGVKGTEEVEYDFLSGRPFIQGAGDEVDIHPNDVSQGRLGDCYFVGSLAAIAHTNPDVIRRMVRDNGDGTYTVTFWRRRKLLAFWEPDVVPVEIVVTPDFPMLNGHPSFAQSGDIIAGEHELWPMLIEKAYAQYKGGYDNIEGGRGYEVMEEFTGVESEWFSPSSLDFDKLAGYAEKGCAITVSSLPDRKLEVLGLKLDIPDAFESNELYVNDTLVTSHEYYITNVDRNTNTITIKNPWGWEHGEITLSFEKFQEAFQGISINSLGS